MRGLFGHVTIILQKFQSLHVELSHSSISSIFVLACQKFQSY